MRRFKLSIERGVVLLLLVTATANLAVCLLPDRPLGRIGNDPVAVKDPAAFAALDFVRAVRNADQKRFVSLLPAANADRLNLEWTLYMNVDLFKTFDAVSVFSNTDDVPSDLSSRNLVLQIEGPYGRIPIRCRVVSDGNGGWSISRLTPPTVSEFHWPTSSTENSQLSDLVKFKTPIGTAARTAVVARLRSKDFAARALSAAGLDGVAGPELLPQLWAVGWGQGSTTLYDGWSGRPTSPTPFSRAIAAPGMLRSAVECRAKAEAIDTVLALEPKLKPDAVWPLLRESFCTGDDEVTAATLQRLAADPATPLDEARLRELLTYLHAHPAKPTAVAAATGLYDIGSAMTGDGRSDLFRQELKSKMEAGGFPLDRSKIDPDDLEDVREQAFDNIVPKALWKE